MLIASLLEPTIYIVGDFWFCFADKTLYEYVQLGLFPAWLSRSTTYVSIVPPAPSRVVGSKHNIWIDQADPNRIPHQYMGGQWIPIVQPGFNFPPQVPLPYDIWWDSNTNNTYAYDATRAKWVSYSGASSNSPYTSNANNSIVGSPAISSPSNLYTINGITSSQAWTSGGQGANPTLVALQYMTMNGSQLQSALKIANLVEIYMDGTIIYDSCYTPDAAAKVLWETIAQFSPVYKESQEIKDLRLHLIEEQMLSEYRKIRCDEYMAMIEYAKARGFQFPEDKPAADPQAAWNAAMGVVV